MAVTPWQVAVLAGSDNSAAISVAWVVWVAYGRDAADTAMLATREDNSRAAADVLLLACCLASLAGVGLGLVTASTERGMSQAAITALAVLSVVASWAPVHAVFTLRHALMSYVFGTFIVAVTINVVAGLLR